MRAHNTCPPDAACAESLTAQSECPQEGAPWVMRLHKSIIKGPLITKVPGVRHMGQQWHRFRTRYPPTAVWKVIRHIALDLRSKWTKKDHFSVGQSTLMQDETTIQILWYYLFAIRARPIYWASPFGRFKPLHFTVSPTISISVGP